MFFIVVLIIIGMLCISAVISATETAFIALSPGLIQKLKSEGDKRANLLLDFLKRKDEVISTLLIGNNLSSIICTTIATSLFIELFGDEVGTIISSFVMSIVIILFAEVVPKTIAVSNPEVIAITVSPVVRMLLKILQPVNILLSHCVKGFCWVFNINLQQKVSAEDEVRGVIDHHMNEGNVVKSDRDMLGAILDIRGMVVSDIMIHRSSVVALDINMPTEKIIRTVLSSPHTRIPFWDTKHDNIIGILHIKNLVNALHNSPKQKDIDVKKLLKSPNFISDNALVVNQLQTFREGKTHLACVINEYGDWQGILTLEDILEEIVGQIYDEHDLFKKSVFKKSDKTYIVDGATTIRDLNREFNWDVPETESATIAGFLIDSMERIPEEGEHIIHNQLKITVMKKMDNRIKDIKIEVILKDV